MDKPNENVLEAGDVTFDLPEPKPVRSVGMMFRVTKQQKAVLKKASRQYNLPMVDLLYPVVDAAIERYEKNLQSKGSV